MDRKHARIVPQNSASPLILLDISARGPWLAPVHHCSCGPGSSSVPLWSAGSMAGVCCSYCLSSLRRRLSLGQLAGQGMPCASRAVPRRNDATIVLLRSPHGWPQAYMMYASQRSLFVLCGIVSTMVEDAGLQQE